MKIKSLSLKNKIHCSFQLESKRLIPVILFSENFFANCTSRFIKDVHDKKCINI